MVFSSLLFVYLFLPLCILVYKLTDGLDNKNTVLIIFSLIFYSWTGPKYLLLLLAMVFINWMAGLLMAGGKRYPARRKTGLWLALIGSLGLLGFFKYTGFFLGTLHRSPVFPARCRKSCCRSVFRSTPSSCCLTAWMCTVGMCGRSARIKCCCCMPACSTNALPVRSYGTGMWKTRFWGGVCPYATHRRALTASPSVWRKRRCWPTPVPPWRIA